MSGQVVHDFRPKLTNGWHQLPASHERAAAFRMGSDNSFHIYERHLTDSERLVVFVEQHPLTSSRGGWHLSISHQVFAAPNDARPGRYPTWDEIKDARYRFTPSNIEMCMILPRPSDFVNIHETCFHLHQHFDRDELGRIA